MDDVTFIASADRAGNNRGQGTLLPVGSQEAIDEDFKTMTAFPAQGFDFLLFLFFLSSFR